MKEKRLVGETHGAAPWPLGPLARAWSGAAQDKRQRLGLFWAVVFGLGLAFAIGAATGVVGVKSGLASFVRAKATALVERVLPPRELSSIPVERTQRVTAYHVLQIDRFHLGRAWDLAEADGNIIFASHMGQLSYMTPRHEVRSLGLDAPIGLDALRGSGLPDNLAFMMWNFRITDLLTIETAPRHFDLYVAHDIYGDGCFRLGVSRVHLIADAERIVAPSPVWERVFQIRDCVPPKPTGRVFAGLQSGGRLVALDHNRVALSVGDFEFDGFNGQPAYPQDLSSDLGKIIEITLSTGGSRTIAMGLRNPQGLALTSAGILWETEHGPQGGDEVNLIRFPTAHAPPVNYGWPFATYGMAYSSRPTPWPGNRNVVGHHGFERPRFAFVPSVGVSNLIEPDPIQFPNWAHHLLVASLVGNSLFLMRVEGDDIVYSEPISFPGDRIRDLISLADGRIAMATDAGDLLILSNAERNHDASPAPLTGLDRLGARIPEEVAAVGPARAGAEQFARNCSQCHSIAGQIGVGPPLNGVVGRRVGSAPGYTYSHALSERQERWTPDRLRAFLQNVETYPGTAMPQPDRVAADDIIAFLASENMQPRARIVAPNTPPPARQP